MSESARMASVDAVWLKIEEPTSLVIVNAVLWLDGPADRDRLAEVLRERLVDRYPRFRQRVVRGRIFNEPRWEEDPRFDLDAHVERVALPAPGDAGAMRALVSREMSRPLDPARPLWKIWVVDGGEQGGAVLARVHHSIADGIALARVLLSLADEQAAGEGAAPPPGRAAAGQPPRRSRSWRRALHAAETAVHAAAELRRVLALPPDPPSPFRGPLGAEKRAAWSRPIPLARVKQAGRAAGGTVNDVLLAAVAGALRRYVEGRGRPPADLRALVPMNLRPLREPVPRELGNRVGLLVLELPLSVEGPLARLQAIKRQMDALKRSPEALVTAGIVAVLGLLPAAWERALGALLAVKASLLMTNVPGPRQPVYLAGSKVRGVMFWVPQPAGLALAVSVFSYAGEVTVGVAGDAGLVPDPAALIEGFHAELDALERAVATAGT